MLELGVDPAAERPEEFPAIYRSLVEQWRMIVQLSGVSPE
jgi:hypothetical protein